MARPSLYSRSPARPARPAPAAAAPAEADVATVPDAKPAPASVSLRARLAGRIRQHERWLWAAGLLLAMVAAGWPAWTAQVLRPLKIEQKEPSLESLFMEAAAE